MVAELKQTAHQHEAAGTGVVAEVEFGVRTVLLAQPGDGLFHGLEVVKDLAMGADLAVPPRFGDRDGDGVFVDIESDVE